MVEGNEYFLCKPCDISFCNPDLHFVLFLASQIHQLVDYMKQPFCVVMDQVQSTVGDRLRIVYRKYFLER